MDQQENKKETLNEAFDWLNEKFNGRGVEVNIIDWIKKEKNNYSTTKLLEEYFKFKFEKIKELKTESQEYGLLQLIKTCLQCNNESQAIRILEKYGFEKQENMYSEEEVNEIIAESWNSCEDNEGELFSKARDRILKQFKKK